MSAPQTQRVRRWTLPPAARVPAVGAAVAGVTTALALMQGGYSVTVRDAFAVAIWWGLIVTIGFGVWPRAVPPRVALIVLGLLAAFSLWTLLSLVWGTGAERIFGEFDRTTLYLGILAVAVVAARRAEVVQWCDGLAVAVTAVGLIALASRCFPSLFPDQSLPAFLPTQATRLSYPLGYWNADGILLGIGTPLLLRAAIGGRSPLVRALALAPIPAFAATIYLTSSRGGIATALVGVVVFVVATGRRWRVVPAAAVAGVASILALKVVTARGVMVNGPLDTPQAASQGHSAALLIALLCIVSAAVYGVLCARAPQIRLPAWAGYAAAGAATVVALVAIVSAHPIRRVNLFKAPPPTFDAGGSGFIKAHILSGNGSGRWQFWAAAADEWKSAKAIGRGAGSFEAWWAQHGTLGVFVRNAHSLYLEVAGTLGVVGFLLLAAALVLGLVEGVRRAVAAGPDERVTVAGLLAAYVAFLVAAGIDWMWEVTVVGAVALVCLGLLVGPATSPAARLRAGPFAPRLSRTNRVALLGALLVTGWLLVCANAIPLLAQVKIHDSESAVAAGHGESALRDALAARNIQPWAASPYLQVALIEEQAGRLASADAAIAKAIDRDTADWRLWLTSARIAAERGRIPEARARLAHAKRLNPRSPLFAAA
jgi:hypothetical protein